MITLQIEVAREVINTNDATIIGILLAVIIVLLTFIGILLKSKKADETYIREQDKANLEMLLGITSTIKEVGHVSSKNAIKIDAINLSTNSILEIIKDRLKQ
jgi:glucose uptake protein GlcU